ncbi:MAG: DUF4147 domain-containing protein [Thaumarchaeota archaeon]|nr:DUF4147 domain-containing protein [Nitrososphaerota archaeon]
MIVRNFKQLARDSKKKSALSIIEAGFAAAIPNAALGKIIKKNFLQVGRKKIFFKKYDRVYVVAIGKSADLMTKVANSLTRIHKGIVVLPDNASTILNARKFTVIRSSHPIPTKKSIVAAKKIIDFLTIPKESDLVLFLISGGASSLVSVPDGVSLEDKQLVTKLLLRSGANIREVNCIRKHLSKIKGGRLVESLGCKAISLVMSDVVGDNLSVIASGITYCDNSTFHDAKKILLKYNSKNRIPKSVWSHIILGTKGLIPETPKRPMIPNYVIRTNRDCVNTMKIHAQKLGFATKTILSLEGDVKDVASKISRHVCNSQNFCLIFGGEPTVTVKGKGKGGRNQELVLHLLKKLRDHKMIVASVGTDGIDGNTNAAGAIADFTMPLKPIDRYLCKNDSYQYFKKYGGLIFTGPTRTNLMDIGIALRRK